MDYSHNTLRVRAQEKLLCVCKKLEDIDNGTCFLKAITCGHRESNFWELVVFYPGLDFENYPGPAAWKAAILTVRP